MKYDAVYKVTVFLSNQTRHPPKRHRRRPTKRWLRQSRPRLSGRLVFENPAKINKNSYDRIKDNIKLGDFVFIITV